MVCGRLAIENCGRIHWLGNRRQIRGLPLPPRTLENVGESELHAISVELKNPN